MTILLAFLAGLVWGMALYTFLDDLHARKTRRTNDANWQKTWGEYGKRFASKRTQAAAADAPPGSWWVVDPPKVW